jgi:hypothetical protein
VWYNDGGQVTVAGLTGCQSLPEYKDSRVDFSVAFKGQETVIGDCANVSVETNKNTINPITIKNLIKLLVFFIVIPTFILLLFLR